MCMTRAGVRWAGGGLAERFGWPARVSLGTGEQRAGPEEGGLGAAAWVQEVLSCRREPWGPAWMPPCHAELNYSISQGCALRMSRMIWFVQ